MKKDVVYYTLLVSCRQLGTQWEVEKRYSEFYALVEKIGAKYPEMPALPPRTLLKTRDEEYLNYRKEELERFLRELCRRREIVLSDEVRAFLNVDDHIPEAQIQRPQLFLEEHICKPIQAAYISRSRFIFTQYERFVAFRLDAYVSRLNIPFIKQTREYVGYTEIHRRTDTGIELEYRAVHDVVSTALAYSEQLGLVMVGFESGEVQGFLTSSVDPSMSLKPHTAAVRGLAFSSDSSHLLSLGEDKAVVALELNSRTVKHTVLLETKPLQLVEWGDKFLVPGADSVAVLSWESHVPLLISSYSLTPNAPVTIAAAHLSQCFLGTASGFIHLYSLDSKQDIGTLVWQGAISALVVVPSRKELIAGNDKGQVAVFSLTSGALLNVTTVDYSGVTYLAWDEATQLLFTSGEERKLRVYRLPASWQVILAESLTDTVEETMKAKTLDDLEGWDR